MAFGVDPIKIMNRAAQGVTKPASKKNTKPKKKPTPKLTGVDEFLLTGVAPFTGTQALIEAGIPANTLAPSTATLKQATSNTNIIRNGYKIKPEKDMPLLEDDVIDTSGGGKAWIQYDTSDEPTFVKPKQKYGVSYRRGAAQQYVKDNPIVPVKPTKRTPEWVENAAFAVEPYGKTAIDILELTPYTAFNVGKMIANPMAPFSETVSPITFNSLDDFKKGESLLNLPDPIEDPKTKGLMYVPAVMSELFTPDLTDVFRITAKADDMWDIVNKIGKKEVRQEATRIRDLIEAKEVTRADIDNFRAIVRSSRTGDVTKPQKRAATILDNRLERLSKKMDKSTSHVEANLRLEKNRQYGTIVLGRNPNAATVTKKKAFDKIIGNVAEVQDTDQAIDLARTMPEYEKIVKHSKKDTDFDRTVVGRVARFVGIDSATAQKIYEDDPDAFMQTYLNIALKPENEAMESAGQLWDNSPVVQKIIADEQSSMIDEATLSDMLAARKELNVAIREANIRPREFNQLARNQYGTSRLDKLESFELRELASTLRDNKKLVGETVTALREQRREAQAAIRIGMDFRWVDSGDLHKILPGNKSRLADLSNEELILLKKQLETGDVVPKKGYFAHKSQGKIQILRNKEVARFMVPNSVWRGLKSKSPWVIDEVDNAKNADDIFTLLDTHAGARGFMKTAWADENIGIAERNIFNKLSDIPIYKGGRLTGNVDPLDFAAQQALEMERTMGEKMSPTMWKLAMQDDPAAVWRVYQNVVQGERGAKRAESAETALGRASGKLGDAKQDLYRTIDRAETFEPPNKMLQKAVDKDLSRAANKRAYAGEGRDRSIDILARRTDDLQYSDEMLRMANEEISKLPSVQKYLEQGSHINASGESFLKRIARETNINYGQLQKWAVKNYGSIEGNQSPLFENIRDLTDTQLEDLIARMNTVRTPTGKTKPPKLEYQLETMGAFKGGTGRELLWPSLSPRQVVMQRFGFSDLYDLKVERETLEVKKMVDQEKKLGEIFSPVTSYVDRQIKARKMNKRQGQMFNRNIMDSLFRMAEDPEYLLRNKSVLEKDEIDLLIESATGLRKYLDEYAERMGLEELGKYRQNYMPHLFDAIMGRRDPNELPPYIWKMVPEEIKNRFLNARVSDEAYGTDPVEAIWKYTMAAESKIAYDPVVKKANQYIALLGDDEGLARNYLQKFATEMTAGTEPTGLDKAFASVMEWGGESLKKLPVLGSRLNIEQGDMTVIGNAFLEGLRDTLYKGTIGGNLATSVKQKFQDLYTIQYVGPKYYALARGYQALGYLDRFKTIKKYPGIAKHTERGRELLDMAFDNPQLRSSIMRDIIQDIKKHSFDDRTKFMAGAREYYDRLGKGLFVPFNVAEFDNRRTAWIGGVLKYLDHAKMMGYDLDSPTVQKMAEMFGNQSSEFTQVGFGWKGPTILSGGAPTKLLTMFLSYPVHTISTQARGIGDALKYSLDQSMPPPDDILFDYLRRTGEQLEKEGKYKTGTFVDEYLKYKRGTEYAEQFSGAEQLPKPDRRRAMAAAAAFPLTYAGYVAGEEYLKREKDTNIGVINPVQGYYNPTATGEYDLRLPFALGMARDIYHYGQGVRSRMDPTDDITNVSDATMKKRSRNVQRGLTALIPGGVGLGRIGSGAMTLSRGGVKYGYDEQPGMFERERYARKPDERAIPYDVESVGETLLRQIGFYQTYEMPTRAQAVYPDETKGKKLRRMYYGAIGVGDDKQAERLFKQHGGKYDWKNPQDTKEEIGDALLDGYNKKLDNTFTRLLMDSVLEDDSDQYNLVFDRFENIYEDRGIETRISNRIINTKLTELISDHIEAKTDDQKKEAKKKIDTMVDWLDKKAPELSTPENLDKRFESAKGGSE
ncbi:hypothetical protein [Sulfuricurvum sp.]|uniref:hypothetical protein n=1 Tax=Sulfuricurvum sp. TaxID=2025608 RepID=UPI0035626580